jgi:hypothetical protein
MQRTLLTIITEASLERRLIADIKARGAHGYTITEAHGEGSRGVRESGFEKAGNIRIEIVCDSVVAERIAHLAEGTLLPRLCDDPVQPGGRGAAAGEVLSRAPLAAA